MTASIRYILIGLIVIMLSALAGWYFFLKGENANIQEENIGRGAGLPQPLAETAGSTYENIVSSFSTLVGGSVESKENKSARLAHVGKSPVAGYGFVGGGSSERLRFVERGSGYIFAVSPETAALERLTNTLVPRTYEAIVTGDRIIMRGLDDRENIVTVGGELTMSTSTQGEPAALKQRRLVDNIRSIALGPAGKEIFYILDSLQGAVGIRASWDEKTQKKIFSSAVLNWQLDFLPDGRIIVTENASEAAAGHAYLVKENSLQPLVKNVQGLTFLPHPRTAAYLYGTSGLFLYARPTTSSSEILLPVRTIADKCVWAPSFAKATEGKPATLIAYCAVPQQLPPANFLDSWYRGEAHTSDSWWKVDVSANTAEQLYSSANATLDVEQPVIDDDGEYIAFTNAIDKTLWLLRIEE
jgi:hypothetical protein